MDDYIELADEPAADPLPVAPRMPAPPREQAPSWKMAGPLMALLPLAMRQGPTAVAALMQGYQQAELMKRQQGQQDWQNQRTSALDAANLQYRNDALQSQRDARQATIDANRFRAEELRRQQLREAIEKYSGALGGVESVDQATALQQQAMAAGVPAEQATNLMMLTATPTKMQRNQARRVIAAQKELFGADWVTKLGDKATFKVGDRTVSLGELLQMSGDVTVDPSRLTANQPSTVNWQKMDVMLDGKLNTVWADPRQAGTYRDLQGLPVEPSRIKVVPPEPKSSGNSGTLPPQAASIVRSFDALPIVKTTQKMAEAVSFADSLDVNTKNAADDQALIYAFAKAMDPDSVVREGEYATVQKYAQSWAQSFGFDIARMFANTPFLTPQARSNMKATIRSRYRAGRLQYDNVRRSYASKINKATNRQDGEEYLTDYAGAFPDIGQAAEQPATGGKRQKVGRFEVEVTP